MWTYSRTASIQNSWGIWYALIVLVKGGEEQSHFLKFDNQPTLSDVDLAAKDFATRKNLEESPTISTDSMTREEFFRRFTNAEIAAIYDAAKANSSVFAYVKLAEINPTINRKHAPTVEGLQLLEQAGLLAVGRANEILGV